MVDSAFSNYAGVFNAREHRVSRDASVRKRNLRAWRTPRDEFGFLDWNIYFHKGCNYLNKMVREPNISPQKQIIKDDDVKECISIE